MIPLRLILSCVVGRDTSGCHGIFSLMTLLMQSYIVPLAKRILKRRPLRVVLNESTSDEKSFHMALTDARNRDPSVCLSDTLSSHSDFAEGQQHRNTASAPSMCTYPEPSTFPDNDEVVHSPHLVRLSARFRLVLFLLLLGLPILCLRAISALILCY